VLLPVCNSRILQRFPSRIPQGVRHLFAVKARFPFRNISLVFSLDLPLDFSLDSLLDFALDWVVEGQTGRLDSGLETNLAPLFYKDQSGTNLAPIWRSPPEALQGFLKLNKLRQAMRGCLMHVMFLFLLLNSFEDLSSLGQAS